MGHALSQHVLSLNIYRSRTVYKGCLKWIKYSSSINHDFLYFCLGYSDLTVRNDSQTTNIRDRSCNLQNKDRLQIHLNVKHQSSQRFVAEKESLIPSATKEFCWLKYNCKNQNVYWLAHTVTVSHMVKNLPIKLSHLRYLTGWRKKQIVFLLYKTPPLCNGTRIPPRSSRNRDIQQVEHTMPRTLINKCKNFWRIHGVCRKNLASRN